MAKLFTIKNISTGFLDIGETVLAVGQSAEIDTPSDKAVAAVAASKATITLNSAAASLAALLNTPVITDSSGGTAVAIANKAVTIAVVDDAAAAADAVATLIDIIDVMRADMLRMAGFVAALATAQQQNHIVKQ